MLAAVSAGLYLGWRAPELISPQTRLQALGMWEILSFLLNASLFILVGLQLPVIVDGLAGIPTGEVIGYSALVCAVVIGARFLWRFTTPYVIRALDRRESQRARRVGRRPRIVVAWSGMRGAVSLAAALALPFETDAGAPFPDRDLILFITFSLILVTVVGQGLTLPALIRRLGVVEDGAEEEEEEMRGRLYAAQAALDRLDELEAEDWTNNDTVERVARDLPLPPAPLQDPRGQDGGRGRHRGPVAGLAADDARASTAPSATSWSGSATAARSPAR